MSRRQMRGRVRCSLQWFHYLLTVSFTSFCSVCTTNPYSLSVIHFPPPRFRDDNKELAVFRVPFQGYGQSVVAVIVRHGKDKNGIRPHVLGRISRIQHGKAKDNTAQAQRNIRDRSREESSRGVHLGTLEQRKTRDDR